jgi:antitoxin ParD1/3/4
MARDPEIERSADLSFPQLIVGAVVAGDHAYTRRAAATPKPNSAANNKKWHWLAFYGILQQNQKEGSGMNISLTKEFENYVSQKVESGMYHSASEVIRDGLRLMKERDDLHQSRLTELRKEIAIGIDEADHGRVQPFNEETTARVKARGRKRLAAQNGSDPA